MSVVFNVRAEVYQLRNSYKNSEPKFWHLEGYWWFELYVDETAELLYVSSTGYMTGQDAWKGAQEAAKCLQRALDKKIRRERLKQKQGSTNYGTGNIVSNTRL